MSLTFACQLSNEFFFLNIKALRETRDSYKKEFLFLKIDLVTFKLKVKLFPVEK